MIQYDQRYCFSIGIIWDLRGSVYFNVLPYALFGAIEVVVLKGLNHFYEWKADEIFEHPYVYQVYTFVLGFVIVFRCNLAYNRFWEGRTNLELMTSKWSDAALQSVVFDNIAKKPEMDRRAFRARMVALFSLLHGTAMATLQDMEFEMEVIEGLDTEAAMNSLNSGIVEDKVFLVFTWIQDTLIRRQDMGGIPVPPPICTRLFQEMSNGMLGFNNANKIHNTPFPFPYAQLITLALLVLTITMGFVVDLLVDSVIWGSLMCFMSIAGYYSINEVAIELEDPFGDDANDLPMTEYQKTFNQRLRPLLHLNEGDFCAPALEIAFAAMAATYDERCSGPLSPTVMSGSGGFLDTLTTGQPKDPTFTAVNKFFKHTEIEGPSAALAMPVYDDTAPHRRDIQITKQQQQHQQLQYQYQQQLQFQQQVQQQQLQHQHQQEHTMDIIDDNPIKVKWVNQEAKRRHASKQD